MTRSSILTVLLVALAALGFTPIASAHYDPVQGRWLERDPSDARPSRLGGLGHSKAYRDGMSLYQYGQSQPVIRTDPTGLCSEDTCGPDITDAIAGHLNDFVAQTQGDLSWFWPSGAWSLEGTARTNGNAGPFGAAVNKTAGCGTGACAGTATLCDMCISQYHIDHILIMAYIAKSYGVTTARSAGQYNESFWLGFFTEGSEVEGSSNAVSNADLSFNEVALCIAKAMKHADENGGVTDLLSRQEICACTKAVSAATQKAIAQKPGKGAGGQTGYQDCKPCGQSIAKPAGLTLPPIDL